MSENKRLPPIHQPKDWWAPIFRGLVMDTKAKHCQRMGSALWLFIYLILNANRRQGYLFRKIKTISTDMGISQRTIRRWLKILKDNGYIKTRRTGRSPFIQVEKWKSLQKLGKSQEGGQNEATQSDPTCPIRGVNSGHLDKASGGPNIANFCQKSNSEISPNEISIKKDLLKIDIDKKKLLRSNRHSFRDFESKTREALLARDIAESLDDYPGLPLYLSLAKKYPETLLRQVLSEVKEIPAAKIKKSRGALFNYLMQQYGRKTSQNSRC